MTIGEIRILSGKSLVQKTARLVYEKNLIFPICWGLVELEV
jgi:hypothetical protein